mmetsp:Transcript_41485/g.69005  ORF Transcript_41485/g.69005 Transcript_41485/m.69005 type:complete len:246 (+) Transcript_41485:369-1106(+)
MTTLLARSACCSHFFNTPSVASRCVRRVGRVLFFCFRRLPAVCIVLQPELRTWGEQLSKADRCVYPAVVPIDPRQQRFRIAPLSEGAVHPLVEACEEIVARPKVLMQRETNALDSRLVHDNLCKDVINGIFKGNLKWSDFHSTKSTDVDVNLTVLHVHINLHVHFIVILLFVLPLLCLRCFNLRASTLRRTEKLVLISPKLMPSSVIIVVLNEQFSAALSKSGLLSHARVPLTFTIPIHEKSMAD